MAWGRRYRRRRSFRRYRRKAERQRLVLPDVNLGATQQGSWHIWQNWRGTAGNVVSPLQPGSGGTAGTIIQEPVSQYIGRVKIDFITAPDGLRFLLVYVPASNLAFSNHATTGVADELIPIASWENSTAIPVSLYEPNQHVMGYGMVTSERKSFYFSRRRRLYSGDALMLICYNHTSQAVHVQFQASFTIQ